MLNRLNSRPYMYFFCLISSFIISWTFTFLVQFSCELWSPGGWGPHAVKLVFIVHSKSATELLGSQRAWLISLKKKVKLIIFSLVCKNINRNIKTYEKSLIFYELIGIKRSLPVLKKFLENSFPFRKYSMCPGNHRTSQVFWGDNVVHFLNFTYSWMFLKILLWSICW